MDIVPLWLHKSMVQILIDHKYCVRHLFDFETLLAGQAVLQMSQISRLCVISMCMLTQHVCKLNAYIL